MNSNMNRWQGKETKRKQLHRLINEVLDENPLAHPLFDKVVDQYRPGNFRKDALTNIRGLLANGSLDECRSEIPKLVEQLEVDLYDEYDGKLGEIKEFMVEKLDEFLSRKGETFYEQAKKDVLDELSNRGTND